MRVSPDLSNHSLFAHKVLIFNNLASPLDGELYTATVSQLSGSDPIIYKEPLRTEQYESKILDSKDFFFKIVS